MNCSQKGVSKLYLVQKYFTAAGYILSTRIPQACLWELSGWSFQCFRTGWKSSEESATDFPVADWCFLDFLRFNRNISCYYIFLPQQCLYFFPLPQGHGSFLPIFGLVLTIVVPWACAWEETAVCAFLLTIGAPGE